MNWEKVWEEGVRRSKNGKEKKDNEYTIVENKYPERELNGFDIFSPIWVSAVKNALMGNCPSLAFEFWREEGWLKLAIPELDKFWGRIQPEKYHPEIDVGIHAMMVIDRSAHYNLPIESRLACLFHDFGKSLTPENEEKHYMHERNGIPLIQKYMSGWKLNQNEVDVILTVGLYHGDVHTFENRTNVGALELMDNMKLVNNTSERNIKVLKAIVCDDQGRKNMFNSEPRGVFLISKCVSTLHKLNKVLEEEGLKELKIREERGISYGSIPYDNEKRARLLVDVKRKLMLREINSVFNDFKKEKKITSAKFKIN
jgi:hypothetical protein